MAWDGSGNYRPTNGVHTGANLWQQAEQANRDIRADDMDGWVADLKATIENVVTRDGQNSPTQNLPMNDKRHTNVANASADDDYAAWGQAKTTMDSKDTVIRNAIEQKYDPAVGTLADQAEIAWNVGDHPFGSAVLGGNRRLGNPTGAEEGGVYIFEAIQDATGSRTLNYGTAYSFGEEGEPVLSSGANMRDYLSFVYRNSKMNLIGLAKGF